MSYYLLGLWLDILFVEQLLHFLLDKQFQIVLRFNEQICNSL